MRKPFFLTFMGAALVLTIPLTVGCKARDPDGQIVATVNGQELTWRDVRAVVPASDPRKLDIRSVDPKVIDGLITLKLLVQQAQHQGLDADADNLALVRHAQDLVLAKRLVSDWSRRVPLPDPRAVERFIVDNPQIFSDRKILAIDQVETDLTGLDPRSLETLRSMDDVIWYLRSHDHSFRRKDVALDTILLSGQTAREIASLEPGEPFVARDGRLLIIRSITSSKSSPIPVDQRALLAESMLNRKNATAFIGEQLAKLRSRADIEYRRGFAPS
jgi:EpsD family peptidyl-prolyl cis-trans isomerase